MWPGSKGNIGSAVKIRKIIGHKSQTYGGAHGLHYCYDYSLSGPINDLLESVAYCYTDDDVSEMTDPSVSNSTYRWHIAHWRACKLHYPDGTGPKKNDGFPDVMEMSGASNGNYMKVLKEMNAQLSMKSLSDIASWNDDRNYSNSQWTSCFLYSDTGINNNSTTSQAEDKIDSLYNFMGACANNNGADVYGCPDNSCCNY